MSAGIYAGRAMMDVLIIEKDKAGGQICLTNEIVNYPGITEISGSEFGAQLKKQAESFGVEFISDEVKDMNFLHRLDRFPGPGDTGVRNLQAPYPFPVR